ncbi:Cytochrome P450 monooxygenase [Apiospora kogelbergensis]|uniref:Cytochrome P450 monooxygenase n=1 Tax=Apiospora kogelbergensis TaxID=1337665 RepID=A0AAW0QEH8_9PEZI
MTQIALLPDLYITALRQEILPLRENGAITHKTIHDATKLDSFVREAGRLSPVSMIGLIRTVRKDFRFRDGTTIPKGIRIGVPTVAIHQNAALYPDPDRFDGFRFSKLREESPADPLRYEASSAGFDYLTFGYGKHVCPGRFFATDLMKLVLAVTVLRYDIKLPPDVKPHKRYFSHHEIPDFNLQVLVRATGKR